MACWVNGWEMTKLLIESHRRNKLWSKKKKDDLKPKHPPKLAPQGIRTFTIFRGHDETGVSGEGIVIEGIKLATGQVVVHWLYPPSRGSIAVFIQWQIF